jgi:hypothetical protein
VTLSILSDDAIDSFHIQILMKVVISNVPRSIHGRKYPEPGPFIDTPCRHSPRFSFLFSRTFRPFLPPLISPFSFTFNLISFSPIFSALLLFSDNFGLFRVNFSDSSRRRVPKDSAFVLSDIARTRQLPRTLVAITADHEEEDSNDMKAQGSKSAAASCLGIPGHFANILFFICVIAEINFLLRS